MSNETSNEPNKPIEARELTDKELEGVVGGGEDWSITLPTQESTLMWHYNQ